MHLLYRRLPGDFYRSPSYASRSRDSDWSDESRGYRSANERAVARRAWVNDPRWRAKYEE